MAMMTDILIQVVFGLITVFMFLVMHGIPQRLLDKIRFRNRPQFQAKRHFVIGAQLLARARSAPSRSATTSLSKEAVVEAEKAIALDPRDAAAHILKALALDLQGFKSSALDSIDVALSPLAVRSLSNQERGDALFKRAELKMALSRRDRVDSALDDLNQAVELVQERGKVFCLFGECYEAKKMKDEAVKAYEDALAAEPKLVAAQKALDRLRT